MKTFLPLINIVLAVALFYFFTDQMVIKGPLVENSSEMTKSVGGINALKQKRDVLNEAITAARQLSAGIQKLNRVFISFTPEQLARLNALLPENVNNTQLVINVNDIAKKSGMSIKNIQITTNENQNNTQNSPDTGVPPTPEVSGNTPGGGVGNVSLSFSVTGTYDALKSFIANLSRSLRLIDLASLSFVSVDNGIYTYNVGLKTYWLR